MSNLVVLDVGHGNCTILRGAAGVVVIDAPIGALLLGTLEDMGINTIEEAFISHADKDHIAGILALLTSDRIHVRKIYVNPDSQRKTVVWNDFIVAVSVAQRKGTCIVSTSLSSTTPGSVTMGDLTIEVVAPSASLALAGVGGLSRDGRTITANTLSAALRITSGVNDGVLLAGDIDEIALDDAIFHGADLSAHTLIFPHHGGLPGSNNVDQYMQKLLTEVSPKSVIFSNGRGRHDNPRIEVVDAVTKHGCAVACTQMSGRCSETNTDNSHLEDIRAHGRAAGACCAGSITIELPEGARRTALALTRFSDFVRTKVATPMCLRLSEAQAPRNITTFVH